MTEATDRVRGLVEDLLSELAHVTQGRLRSLDPSQSTLATVPLHATLDTARDTRAALPGLVSAEAGAEADAGPTARTEAAARVLDLDALAYLGMPCTTFRGLTPWKRSRRSVHAARACASRTRLMRSMSTRRLVR